jgi:hypothetical protein
MPGPPDHFPVTVDLTGLTTAQIQTALNNSYAAFWTTYGYYPHDTLIVGTVAFLGQYS